MKHKDGSTDKYKDKYKEKRKEEKVNTPHVVGLFQWLVGRLLISSKVNMCNN